MCTTAAVRKARRALKDAAEALEAEIAISHPPGSDISWEKRGHRQYGKVVGCGRDALRVYNDATGKTYWVDLFFIYGPSR